MCHDGLLGPGWVLIEFFGEELVGSGCVGLTHCLTP